MTPSASRQDTVVVVGHGMVGHRFVQEFRARDPHGSHRVLVLCEEPVARTRVQ